MPNQYPLFITRFSLSSRTAIGVQTKLLLEPYHNWLHFHWVSNEVPRQHVNSHRLENILFSRLGFLNRNNRVASKLRQMGASCWANNLLRDKILRRIVGKYKDSVSVIYLAPLDNADSMRMKQLVMGFGKPFVLHLWDMLDGPVKSGSCEEWLITHAESVLCLSKPILDDVLQFRSQADYLLFGRNPAVSHAAVPQQKLLRIALIGNLGSYSKGVDLLNEAIDSLATSGVTIQVVFIGPPSTLKRMKSPIFSKVQSVGFAKTDADRDTALSSCHVAFLPGPMDSPESDVRSKYSIPSRVLDFFAVGLPVVGTVNRGSATADLLRTVDITSDVFCRSAKEIAVGLEKLADPSAWKVASAVSREAFLKLHQEFPPEKLQSVFESIKHDALQDNHALSLERQT